VTKAVLGRPVCDSKGRLGLSEFLWERGAIRAFEEEEEESEQDSSWMSPAHWSDYSITSDEDEKYDDEGFVRLSYMLKRERQRNRR
jgi:hypothetical protein